MRANIASLPDGTYSYDDFLDNDGVTDQPLRIALDLTIAGETMRLDFSRSSPPCRGPLNIARSTAVACCYVALKHRLHRRSGERRLSRADRVRHSRHDAARRIGAKAGRWLYRNDPARHRRGVRRVRQSRAGARQWQRRSRTINALSLAGWRANGLRWVMFSFFGGGLGGNPEGDGLNHGNNPISTATIPPAEILEALYPVVFTQWALRPDSARTRPAPRRPRRHLRDRGACRRRRRGISARRAGQISAVRRQWRQAGCAQPLYLSDRRGRALAAARLEDHRRAYPPRPARAAGNAGRRRIRRPVHARSGARRPRRGARLRVARSGVARLRRGAREDGGVDTAATAQLRRGTRA